MANESIIVLSPVVTKALPQGNEEGFPRTKGLGLLITLLFLKVAILLVTIAFTQAKRTFTAFIQDVLLASLVKTI